MKRFLENLEVIEDGAKVISLIFDCLAHNIEESIVFKMSDRAEIVRKFTAAHSNLELIKFFVQEYVLNFIRTS